MRARRVTLAVVAALTAVVSSSVMTGSVDADQFSPVPGPPKVENLLAPSEIQPKYPDSSSGGGGVYTVSATVSTNASLAALDTVTMCWYKTTFAVCDDAAPDPKVAFVARWTESEEDSTGIEGFAVLGSNRYALTSSSVDTDAVTPGSQYYRTKQSLAIVFSFKVSSAMRAGTDWKVRVTAVYDVDLCNGSPCAGLTESDRTGSAEIGDLDVAYWGQVTTALDRFGFGVVAENSPSDVQTADDFAFVANGPSDYSLSGTSFVYDPDGDGATAADTLSLTTATPGSKQVKIECMATSHTGTVYKAFTGSPQTLGAPLVETGETPKGDDEIDCKLSYGSGATYALRAYASTVTLSVVQR